MSAGRRGVPAGPLESAPAGFVPGSERSALLAGALGGVELGAWDRQVAGWLAGWDAAIVLTIASWAGRAREAGAAR